MYRIGTTYQDAVDWLQEQLRDTGRPRAERTYAGLLERGDVVDEDDGIFLTETATVDHIYTVAAQEDILQQNKVRARMQRRHHSPTVKTRRKTRTMLKQGNNIDCVSDDDVAE